MSERGPYDYVFEIPEGVIVMREGHIPELDLDVRPIHVRVAERLGWSQMEPGGILLPDSYVGYPPTTPIIGYKQQVPRYDTDWEAMGPEIHRLMMSIKRNGRGDWYADVPDKHGDQSCYHIPSLGSNPRPCGCAANTPLMAACLCLLKLPADALRP